MTRPRALSSIFRSVIALLTALLVSFVGATALPATALAGSAGQAKGQQAERTDKPSKAHQQGKAHQQSKADTAGKSQSSDKPQISDNPQQASKAQSSDKAQKPAKAQEPTKARTAKPTRGQSGQADKSQTSQGAPASTPGDKGDPAGNNGTVKLAGFGGTNGPGHSSGDGSTPMHPSNDPHLPCDFSVEWFGFDSGVTSEVTFVQHAPTRGGKPHYDSVPLDNDSHSGGGSTAGYDGVETYNLDFEGDPHPVHGYHVKLTTETPYSQGSDRKHKVFWVEPCEDSDIPPGEETPDEETPDEETPDEETPDEETPDDNGVQDTVDENGGNTSTVVFGAQATIQDSAQAAQSAAGGAQVPTVVASGLTGDEAGLTGDKWSRSVLPLLAVLFGFGTTFVALVRRRTRVQTVTSD
ncbi:MAG: hypothetical protein ACRDOZ_07955 [Nocardioides sp.]